MASNILDYIRRVKRSELISGNDQYNYQTTCQCQDDRIHRAGEGYPSRQRMP